jgi:hypothetical protein
MLEGTSGPEDGYALDRLVGLQALLIDSPSVLSPREQALLTDWLERLVRGEAVSRALG